MNTCTRVARIISAPIFFGFFLLPTLAFASNIEISPKVIDIKGRPREISHHAITIKSKTSSILSMFVWAIDVDQSKGALSKEDMSGTNTNSQTTSPSRWLEISRSISVLPKEEQTIPLQLQIPGQVKPGIYHVALKFSTGETQNDAMQCAACTEDVSINIEVTEDIREKLQLYSFAAMKNIFVQPKADFNFSVENTGNKTVVPSGKIRIFDNSGKEVGLIDVNIEGKQIEPKAKDMLAASWAAKGKFGKYKALLDVNYGQRGTMQDVVYFWVIPWTRLITFVFTIALVMIITMLFVRSRGMARPSYAYNYGSDDEEEEKQYTVDRIEKRNTVKQYNQTSPEEVVLQTRTNQLTEVNIPLRTRTVPPNMSVQIEQKKSRTGEEHIVRLK